MSWLAHFFCGGTRASQEEPCTARRYGHGEGRTRSVIRVLPVQNDFFWGERGAAVLDANAVDGAGQLISKASFFGDLALNAVYPFKHCGVASVEAFADLFQGQVGIFSG